MEEETNQQNIWLIVIGVIGLLLFAWYLFLNNPASTPDRIITPVVIPSTDTNTTIEKNTTETREILVTPEVMASPTAIPSLQ